MGTHVQQLSEAVAALADAWARAVPPVMAAELDPSLAAGAMSDAGLVGVLGALGEVTKRVESLGAVVAGEIARRSSGEARSDGLAKRTGHASPERMIAQARGGKVGRAVELLKVGGATAARRTLSGEALPAHHPHVAAALHSGRVGVDSAHLIITMLDRVASRAHPAELDAAEALLTRQAEEFTFVELEKLVKYAEARLDPDGLEPREEDEYAARSPVMREDPSGMLHLRGLFDPITGAQIKLTLEAYAEARMRESRGSNRPELVGAIPPVPAETRTVAQIQADALAEFLVHIRGCTATEVSLPSIAMVVRVDLTDLEERAGGTGIATIDGVDQPISAGAARRLAASAHLIPAVLGGDSIPLDLGRAKRAISRGQVLALWERDGECAFCGQTTLVEAHHIRWWQRDGGRTDLANGVLLCSRCHHRIHRDGWEIRVRPHGGGVWFRPPPEIDPRREPRRAAANPRRRQPQAA